MFSFFQSSTSVSASTQAEKASLSQSGGTTNNETSLPHIAAHLNAPVEDEDLFEIIDEVDEGFVEVDSSGLKFDSDESDDELMVDPHALRMQKRVDELTSHLLSEQTRSQVSQERATQLELEAQSLRSKNSSEQARAEEAENQIRTALLLAKNYERSLDETQTELTRLKSIHQERNGQLETLRQQKDDLNAQANQLATNIETLQRAVKDRQREMASMEAHHRKAFAASQMELAIAENKVTILQDQQKATGAKSELITTALQDLRQELKFLTEAEKSHIQTLKERTSNAERKAVDYEARMANQSNQLEALHAQKEQLHVDAARSQLKLEALQQDVKTLRDSLETANECVERHRQKALELEVQAATLQSKLRDSRSEIEAKESALKECERNLIEQQVVNRHQTLAIRELEESCLVKTSALERKLYDTNTSLTISQTRVEEEEKRVIDAEQRVGEARGEVLQLRAQLTALKTQMEKNTIKTDDRIAKAERNLADTLQNLEAVTRRMSEAMKQSTEAEERARRAEAQARDANARLEEESARAVQQARETKSRHFAAIRKADEHAQALQLLMKKAAEEHEMDLRRCLKCADCDVSLDHRIAFNFVFTKDGKSALRSYCNKCSY